MLAGKISKALFLTAVVSISIICVYLFSSLLVFSYGNFAYKYDEEYSMSGKDIICGPRPRNIFCYPTYHDWFYTGSEWPFVMYWPICYFYAQYYGCELPR